MHNQLSEQGDCRDALAGLSKRAATVLILRGFDTREKVLAGLARGEIAARGGARWIGPKTYLEVCAWAAVTPTMPGRRWKFDPYTGKALQTV